MLQSQVLSRLVIVIGHVCANDLITARRFNTGSAPGSPRQTGQTLVLGGAPKLVGHPQKIFVAVESCTCTSSPMTGSYRPIISGVAAAKAEVDMVFFHYNYGLPGRFPRSELNF